MATRDKDRTLRFFFYSRGRQFESMIDQLRQHYQEQMDAWMAQRDPRADTGNIADEKATFRTTRGEGFQDAQYRGSRLFCGRCGALIDYAGRHACRTSM